MALRRTVEPVIEPFTTAEAKAHLREQLVDAGNDAYIDRLAKAARVAAENKMDRSIMLQTWELTLDRFPSAICLEKPPILGVTSVEYIDQFTGQYVTLSPTSYIADLKSEPGWIVPAYNFYWPFARWQINSVRVTYTAGYSADADAAVARAAVPEDTKQWILLLLADLYSNRSGNSARPVSKNGFVDDLLDQVWSV